MLPSSYSWCLVCKRCGSIQGRGISRRAAEKVLSLYRDLPNWRCGCGSREFTIQQIDNKDDKPPTSPVSQVASGDGKKTVFILGAGFSVEAGAPVVNGFFSKFPDPTRSGFSMPNEELVSRINSVLDFREDLLQQRGLPLDSNQINIEQLFRHVQDKVTQTSNDEFKDLRYNLIYFITKILHDSLFQYLINEVYNGTDDNCYVRFARCLTSAPERFSLITFNYDPVVEFACIRGKECNIDYGLWRAPADLNLREPYLWADKTLKLLKIHGSTNWVKCFNCGNIHLKGFYVEDFPVCFFHLYERCSCCRSMNAAPFLVPPIPNKSLEERENALLQVLAKAHEELVQADRIVVIGYSMPPYDESVRLILFWSTIMDNYRLRDFVVVDPSEATLRRYAEEFAWLDDIKGLRLLKMTFPEFIASKEFQEIIE